MRTRAGWLACPFGRAPPHGPEVLIGLWFNHRAPPAKAIASIRIGLSADIRLTWRFMPRDLETSCIAWAFAFACPCLLLRPLRLGLFRLGMAFNKSGPDLSNRR